MFVLYRVDELGVDMIACSPSAERLKDHPQAQDRLDEWGVDEEGHSAPTRPRMPAFVPAFYHIVPCEEMD